MLEMKSQHLTWVGPKCMHCFTVLNFDIFYDGHTDIEGMYVLR